MPPWGSAVPYDKVLAQNKHLFLPYKSYSYYFQQQCSKYDHYFSIVLRSVPDSMLNVGLVTPFNTYQYIEDINALVAENYSYSPSGMAVPVTPSMAQDVMQRFSLLVIDKTNALIYDTGASAS
eukprot:14558752-Ditylum_brightwellii.AAC.3